MAELEAWSSPGEIERWFARQCTCMRVWTLGGGTSKDVGYSDFGFCKPGQPRRRQHRNLSPHPGALDAGIPGDGSRAEVTARIAHAGRPEASPIRRPAYGPARAVSLCPERCQASPK